MIRVLRLLGLSGYAAVGHDTYPTRSIRTARLPSWRISVFRMWNIRLT